LFLQRFFSVLFLGLYTQREAEGCERRSAKAANEQAKRVQAHELALYKPTLTEFILRGFAELLEERTAIS
jgi:hypothetical protein